MAESQVHEAMNAAIEGMDKAYRGLEAKYGRLVRKHRRLRKAAEALLPFIAERGMEGETGWERAVKALLVRYGADQFAYGWSERGAMIGFRYERWSIRFLLPLPTLEDAKLTRGGRRRYSKIGELYP